MSLTEILRKGLRALPDLMDPVEPDERTQHAEALRGFIHNIHAGEDLSVADSLRAIERGMVEIMDWKGRKRSQGLLITDNGYFLTAEHCIPGWFSRPRIRLADGSWYPITRICSEDEQHDIMLAKADLPGKLEPCDYRFYQQPPQEDMIAYLLTRRRGKLERVSGNLIWTTSTYTTPVRDGSPINGATSFRFDIRGIPGDSGAPVVNLDGRLLGINMAAGVRTAESYCVRIMHALNVVAAYAGKLSAPAHAQSSR